jgi:ribosomal-protein-alanine N-acetyltransferase
MDAKPPVPQPVLPVDELIVRTAGPDDVDAVLDFFARNREFLRPFTPPRTPDFYTRDHWQARVERDAEELARGESLKLYIFEGSGRVIGTVSCTRIVRAPAHTGQLGYALDERAQGRGVMTRVLPACIRYLFEVQKLHRIGAAYMPTNARSGRLLRRLGFTVEGYARDYLLIDGQWQDHLQTALLNPDWRAE